MLLLASLSVEALQINEIQYAPFSGSEWLELYNPTTVAVNLSGWKFADNSSTDYLVCCTTPCDFVLEPEEYLLITSQGSTVLNGSNVSILCVDDASLGNGLGNEQDSATFFNASHNFTFTYDQSMGANRNNKTLERRADGSWGESLFAGGTPGAKNSIFSAAADYQFLQLSEIMPDPFDADDDPKPWGEWVELYNGGSKPLYLGGLILKDARDDHELIISEDKVEDAEDLFLSAQGFVIIYRDGDTDFSLNNDDYEEVRLYYEDTLLDSMSYAGSTEGMTWGLVEESWYKTILTPNEENFLEKECDWLLQFTLNDSIARPEDFIFKVSLLRDFGFPENITVRGEITDVNGDIIREYAPWTDEHTISDRHKLYSPNLPDGFYRLHFWMEELDCLEYDDTDNDISQLFSINPFYQNFAPELKLDTIEDGSDDEVRWGEQFLVKISVYKGNQTESKIQLWAEQDDAKVSAVTTISLAGSYRNYPLSLPVQLYPNCDGKFAADEITIFVKGFGKQDSATVNVEGMDSDLCQEVEVEANTKTSAVRYRPLEVPLFISPGESQEILFEIANGDGEHRYDLWSYLYRGKTCYSCHGGPQEGNAQGIFLLSGEVRMVALKVTPDAKAAEGKYNLKVRVRKDDQVGVKEFTFPIQIAIQEKTLIFPVTALPENYSPESSMKSSQIKGRNGEGFIVYQSSSQKAPGILPLLLVVSFGLLGLVLWKERRKA